MTWGNERTLLTEILRFSLCLYVDDYENWYYGHTCELFR